jgi:carbonic anhydrase
VNAALQPSAGRVVDHWIRNVRDIAKHYKADLEGLPTADAQSRRLCELNVAVQVVHVRESPVLLASDNEVKVHGWIYDVGDGRLQDLTPMVDEVRALEPSVRLH